MQTSKTVIETPSRGSVNNINREVSSDNRENVMVVYVEAA
jgi:hypothetical protein